MPWARHRCEGVDGRVLAAHLNNMSIMEIVHRKSTSAPVFAYRVAATVMSWEPGPLVPPLNPVVDPAQGQWSDAWLTADERRASR